MESSTTAAAAAAAVGGFSLTSADRLRIYRKCFHDLDEHLLQLQQEGLDSSDAEVTALQAEIRCLEELIMIFTDITSILPSIAPKTVTGDGFDPSLPSVDGLNLSLVTDILMLSATSPWTVFVAERSQWQICYVSPSVKRAFGWKASDLLGVPAWDGCHTEDIPTLQRMLLLKEGGSTISSLVYRRLKKDRSYATVQATGRAVGTRWYAWVEQDTNSSSIANGTPHSFETSQDLPLSLPASKSSSKTRSSDSDTPSIRPRKISSTQRPTLEAEGTSRGWSSTARPASPLASLPGLERQTRPLKNKNGDSDQHIPAPNHSSVDVDAPADENQIILKSQGLSASTTSHLSGSFSGSDTQTGDKSKKGKALQHDETGGTPKPKAPGLPLRPVAASQSALQSDEVNELWGKKVLLVEDDRVNRTIAQRLLENLKCHVTVACNGKEALDILQEGSSDKPEIVDEGKEIPPQFDLVLMDLLMPVMDGTKAVEYFRDWEAEQEPPRKRMTIFALTSNVSDGDMVKCAISGFDEFVSKPLTIDKLVERLQPKH